MPNSNAHGQALNDDPRPRRERIIAHTSTLKTWQIVAGLALTLLTMTATVSGWTLYVGRNVAMREDLNSQKAEQKLEATALRSDVKEVIKHCSETYHTKAESQQFQKSVETQLINILNSQKQMLDVLIQKGVKP